MNNSTLSQDLKEANKLSAETWYSGNNKTKLDQPNHWSIWIIALVFSFLAGLLASLVAFYYMWFINMIK